MKSFIKFTLALLCAFILMIIFSVYGRNLSRDTVFIFPLVVIGAVFVLSLIISCLISIFFIKRGKFKSTFQKSILPTFIISFLSFFVYVSYSKFTGGREADRFASLSLEERLEEEFIEDPKQKFLHISNSEDSIFPKNIGKFSHIDYLSIRQTNIRTLPKEFAQLTNLELLSLDRNKFDTLPEIIFELKNLERLHIMGNHITYISPNIKKLESLKNLSFYGAGAEEYLKSIPKEIGELPKLEHLALNNIDSFPKELGNLNSLTSLMLHQTSFNEFPAFLFELKNIERITIAFRPTQPFPHITKDFEKLKTLKYLRFMYIYPSDEEKKKLQELLPNTEIEY
ncbi:leucine-rich repeat domain-containing protein [Bernardetia sp. ABR2-2B]|uniref:leucine-rich repeat domain-containing protein n=1 Tax=Bernardetia sp. ABR2-2B TaxID=3127472 RepID=UPI0030D3D820